MRRGSDLKQIEVAEVVHPRISARLTWSRMEKMPCLVVSRCVDMALQSEYLVFAQSSSGDRADRGVVRYWNFPSSFAVEVMALRSYLEEMLKIPKCPI